MCILELSKELMYEFDYNYMTSKYENKSKQLNRVIGVFFGAIRAGLN